MSEASTLQGSDHWVAVPRERAERRVWAGLLLSWGLMPVSVVVFAFAYAQWFAGATKGAPMFDAANSFAVPYLVVVGLPSVVAGGWLLRRAHRDHPKLARLVWHGLLGGTLATFALDGIRLTGVQNGWLPMDNVLLFGQMITGPGADWHAFYPLGLTYHFMNGASFGLIYALAFGVRKHVAQAFVFGFGWLSAVEIGMMILPPMSPMVGPFGVAFAFPHLFLTTLLAHLAFALVLVLVVQASGVPAGIDSHSHTEGSAE